MASYHGLFLVQLSPPPTGSTILTMWNSYAKATDYAHIYASQFGGDSGNFPFPDVTSGIVEGDVNTQSDMTYANIHNYQNASTPITRVDYGNESTNDLTTLASDLTAAYSTKTITGITGSGLHGMGFTVCYIPTGKAIDDNSGMGTAFNNWMSTADLVLYQSEYRQDDATYITEVVATLNAIVAATGGKPYRFKLQCYSKATGLAYTAAAVEAQLDGVTSSASLTQAPQAVELGYNSGSESVAVTVFEHYRTHH